MAAPGLVWLVAAALWSDVLGGVVLGGVVCGAFGFVPAEPLGAAEVEPEPTVFGGVWLLTGGVPALGLAAVPGAPVVGLAVWSVVAAGGVLCPLIPLSPAAEPAGGCELGVVVVVLCVLVVDVDSLLGFCVLLLEVAACPLLLQLSETLSIEDTAMLPSLACVP